MATSFSTTHTSSPGYEQQSKPVSCWDKTKPYLIVAIFVGALAVGCVFSGMAAAAAPTLALGWSVLPGSSALVGCSVATGLGGLGIVSLPCSKDSESSGKTWEYITNHPCKFAIVAIATIASLLAVAVLLSGSYPTLIGAGILAGVGIIALQIYHRCKKQDATLIE